MNVVAMLAWWDEPTTELEACVRSMSVLCDKVVAVDGAYKMTPGATAASPPEQAEAIEAAAVEAGLEAVVIVPDEVWTGQVAKRDFMLKLAAADADWLIAVDADHRLRGEREPLRRELASLGQSVDSILHDFFTPYWGRRSALASLSPHPWHTKLAGDTIEHSLLFRRLRELRVEKAHWGYSGVNEAGIRVSLGSWREEPRGVHARLETPFRIDHLCFERDQMRLDRNRDYCRVRDDFVEANGYEP